MRLGLPTDGSGPLGRPLVWLTGVRLVVLTIFLWLISTVYLQGFSLGGFSNTLAVGTIAVAFTLAGIYAALLRTGRATPAIATSQLISDQLTWTFLVYVTGGPASGATSLYGFTCLSWAILLGVRGGVTALVAGVVSYMTLTAGLIEGWIAPPLDQSPESYLWTWGDSGYTVGVNLLAMLVVTSLASYLADRLRVAGGRLEVATQRAEDVEHLAELGEIAAGLAHEIRNPLGSIRGSIELLRTSGSLSDEEKRLCEIVEGEASRLNDLVSDMLDLSKPRTPKLVKVDLAVVCQDVVTLAVRSGRGSDVEVRCEGLEEAFVRADADQLRQLVWNLVRNAVQASSGGDEVIVRVAEDTAPDRVVLEVEDSGPGISPEARQRIFDGFFTTRSKGTGVGLAVVKRIADSHQFTVDVRSEEGQGATFRVGMPKHHSDEVAVRPAQLSGGWLR